MVTTDEYHLTAADYISAHAKSVMANVWFDECTEVLWDLYSAENGTRCYITDAMCEDAVCRIGRTRMIPLVVMQSPERSDYMDGVLIYKPNCNNQGWDLGLIERTVTAAERVVNHFRCSPGTMLNQDWNNKEES